MPSVDCHLTRRALQGGPDCCGDDGIVVQDGEHCFVALVDALGHGRAAAEVANQAVSFLAANHATPLAELMIALHEHLKGSRGAVAFLGRLHLPSGGFRYCGMGNIGARIYDTACDHRSLVSKDGVLGYMTSTPREESTRLAFRDMLLLTSDGIRQHFEPFDHPGIFKGDAGRIAASALEALAKGDDDASCLVLRYLK